MSVAFCPVIVLALSPGSLNLFNVYKKRGGAWYAKSRVTSPVEQWHIYTYRTTK